MLNMRPPIHQSPEGTLLASSILSVPDITYTRPEDYFGRLNNVPVGWLQT